MKPPNIPGRCGAGCIGWDGAGAGAVVRDGLDGVDGATGDEDEREPRLPPLVARAQPAA
jgi:hypothetical protein